MNYLHGKSILVTGGTGSFGRSIEDKDCYRILPVLSSWTNSKTDFLNVFVSENFSYTSGNKSERLGTKGIRAFLDQEA